MGGGKSNAKSEQSVGKWNPRQEVRVASVWAPAAVALTHTRNSLSDAFRTFALEAREDVNACLPRFLIWYQA